MIRELTPVRRGDLVRISIDGESRLYRARRSVRDIGNLKLRDLQPDPVSDANAFLATVLNAKEARSDA